MSRSIFFLIICFLATPLLGQPAEKDRLFVIHAKRATLNINAEKDQIWTLVLQQVDESVAFFTEAPNRQAGTFSLKNFLTYWEKHDQLKNAGFIFFEIDNAGYNEVALQVYDPVYNKSNQTLTFNVHFLNSNFSPSKKIFNEVTLFIDLSPLVDKSLPSVSPQQHGQSLPVSSGA